jgi:Zn-finger nucleic acid-binding protein
MQRTTKESLEHFRTIAFGIDWMRSKIQRDRDMAGSLDASIWWATVPECYRPVVEPLLPKALERFRGRKMTAESIDGVIRDLNTLIWESVEPIDPGSHAAPVTPLAEAVFPIGFFGGNRDDSGEEFKALCPTCGGVPSDYGEMQQLRAALKDALGRLASWVSDEPHPERPDSMTDAEIYDQEKIAELRKRFDLK